MTQHAKIRRPQKLPITAGRRLYVQRHVVKRRRRNGSAKKLPGEVLVPLEFPRIPAEGGLELAVERSPALLELFPRPSGGILDEEHFGGLDGALRHVGRFDGGEFRGSEEVAELGVRKWKRRYGEGLFLVVDGAFVLHELDLGVEDGELLVGAVGMVADVVVLVVVLHERLARLEVLRVSEQQTEKEVRRGLREGRKCRIGGWFRGGALATSRRIAACRRTRSARGIKREE